MSFKYILGLCTLASAAIQGPVGPAGTQLFANSAQVLDVRYGILQSIHGQNVSQVAHPVAWGRDSLGQLIYLNSNYSLWRYGANPELLAASTPLDQSIAGRELYFARGKLYYGSGNNLTILDLALNQTQSVFLGEAFGSLAYKNGVLYRSAPLIKKSNDGGITWSALVLADAGTLRNCGDQILVLGKTSYSYLDAQGQWQNTPWQAPNQTDLAMAPLVCRGDTMVLMGSQGLNYFKIGAASSFQTLTFNSLGLGALQSFSLDAGNVYLANDTATWMVSESSWNNPQRLNQLAMALGAEPIWQNSKLSLLSDQKMWNYASGIWNSQNLPAANMTLFVHQGQALALNQSKIYTMDPSGTSWTQSSTLPASQSEMMSVGGFLLSQGMNTASYSMDLGVHWQNLNYGDLQSHWFATPTQLCASIHAAKDSLICSSNWQKQEIPAVVSSNTPTLSSLGENLILADGFATWISRDSAQTWQKYGSETQPQIAQVMSLGNQRYLALCAVPGWRQNAELWSRARMGWMSSVDGGQSWQELESADTNLWTTTPAIRGDTLFLASVAGDLYSWNLNTGKMLNSANSGLTAISQSQSKWGVRAEGEGQFTILASPGQKFELWDPAGHLLENWIQNQNQAKFQLKASGIFYLRSASEYRILVKP